MVKRFLPLGFAALLLPGCLERATPTSPLVEQAVFQALGGLRVGEAMRFRGVRAAEILVGSPNALGEFVYIPFHASRSHGSRLQVEVESVGSTEEVGAAPPLGPGSLRAAAMERRPSDAMHMHMLGEMTRSAHERRAASRPALHRTVRHVRAETNLGGGNAFVGQLVELNGSTGFCDVVTRTARVEAISERAILVADIENPAGGYTRADYEEIGERFDSFIRPTITRYFGEPTDIDENGRVIIFVTRVVNELTGPEDSGFIGGFHHTRDLFPPDECAGSNLGEIFYLLAPDPNAEASHVSHPRDVLLRESGGVIGHEFEHLINAGRRIYINEASVFEESWLNEGLAHIGEELLFYAATGLESRRNVDFGKVIESAEMWDALLRYGHANLARYELYLQDVPGHAPVHVDDDLETRGAAWAFLRYVADHSGETDEAFFKPLVNSRLAGFDNLSTKLGGQPLAWLQDWGVSVYTDDLLATAAPLYQQPSWNFRSLLEGLTGGFPLEVPTLGAGESLELDLLATTSAFVRVRGNAGQTARVRGTSGGETPPPELWVTVVRME